MRSEAATPYCTIVAHYEITVRRHIKISAQMAACHPTVAMKSANNKNVMRLSKPTGWFSGCWIIQFGLITHQWYNGIATNEVFKINNTVID